jgi:hypothetical protein
MKKRKFMGFLAMLSCATLLTGCDLPGPLQTAVDWADEKVVSPIKNLIPGGKKDEQVDPEPEPKPEPKPEPTPVEQKFSVSFSAGEGSGSMASVSDVKGEYVLPQSGFTAPEGYEFAGWKVNGSGDSLAPGAKIEVSADVSLVAQWSVIPGISLKELPEYGFVDEELDLDEYVELVGASDYSVALSDDSKAFASLEGHKINFEAEGEIEFTVSIEGGSAKGSLTSIRESRLEFAEYVEGVERNYVLGEIDYVQTAGADTEDEEDDEYDYDYVDFLYHGDNYLLTYASWDKDEETGKAIPGGFLKFSEDDNDAYYFTLAYDEQGNESVVVGEKTSSLLLDWYNGPLGLDFLDFSKFEFELYQEIDEETEEVVYEAEQYVMYDEDAMAFAENSLLMPYGCIDGSAQQYPINKVEFTLDYYFDEETEDFYSVMSLYAYTTFQGAPYLWSMYELYPEVTHELLDEFCVPENKPQSTDYWNYFSDSLGLGDFFLSPESFVGPNGLIEIEYGWVDDEGNAIDVPDDATTGNLFIYMPVGSETYIMTENSIWLVDSQYNPVSGKMAVTSEGEEPVTTVYNIFSAESESGYFAEEADEGVWEGANAFIALASRENFAEGSIAEVEDLYKEVPAEEEGGEPTQEYDGTVFYFYQGYAKGFIDALVAGDDGLYYLGAVIDAWASTQDLYQFFVPTVIIDPNSGYVNIVCSFGWADNQNWQVSFTSMYYPGVASLASSFEGYMIANVIE